VKELEKIDEVVECYYTTGDYDLLIKVYVRNNHDLLSLIHEKIQPIGLARTETLICFKEAFRKKLPINFTKEVEK
jgi:Lrp/AsnC family transcriptional regulator for asnA, asnC and gidA